MDHCCRGWYWKKAGTSLLVMGGAIATSFNCALAQITPDGTLGAESSVVTPTSVNGFPGNQIDGGATRGANLFHSFEQFSVPTGGEAFFNNALDIQNIISRVTGLSISNIDGLLRANGTANLFLLNPNGIVFGPNASLSIGGSFVGSTASAVNFADGTSFSATAPTTTPLLTVSVPIGLQYGRTAGAIQVQGTGLQVPTGYTLALMGGDVRLNNGILYAPGGRVELGGVAGAGTVGLNVEGNNLSLSYLEVGQRADISLTNGAGVYVTAGGGGSIAVNAQNLDISGGSFLYAGIAPGLGTVGSRAGDIEINATDSVRISGEPSVISGVINVVGDFTGSTALGSAGDIVINTDSLEGIGSFLIGSATGGQGNAGNVTIQARDLVSFVTTGGGAVFSIIGPTGVGNGADINIQTQSLALSNGPRVTTSTLGQGNAGNIQINGTESISVSSGSLVQTDSLGQGNAGDLGISTKQLIVQDGAQISAGTSAGSQGNGGTLTVNALDSVELSGTSADGRTTSGLFAQTEGTGDARDLRIDTRRLIVQDGAVVSSGTIAGSQGNGGTLTVNALDSVELIGTSQNGQFFSGLFTDSQGAGAAGDLTIDTEQLIVRDGALAAARTFGEGQGGTLAVNASESVELIGGTVDSRFASGLFTTVQPRATGDGGNLTVETGRLLVRDGAQVFAGTFGVGSSGTLEVSASESVELSGRTADGQFPSGLLTTAEPGATGDGGNLTVETGRLIVQDGAGVFASTSGEGSAGTLTIAARESVEVSDTSSVSVSSTGSGDAGNLEVAARSIRLGNESAFSANTTAGQGNIILRSEDLVLRRGSNITTNATGTATGGNIFIDTGVLTALENSDISANSINSFGGQVTINAQGIFGTQFRINPTLESDITATGASSELSGTVEINNPDIDPSQGLVELPAELVDVSNSIAQGCPASVRSGESRFVITGRGGLPPNPNEPLTGDNVLTDWNTLDSNTENRSSTAPATNSTRESVPTQIVEANGWMINNKGDVVLTASAPTATLDIPWLPKSDCNAPELES